MISETIGDSPWFPPVVPVLEESTAMLMCSSPSDDVEPLGDIYSHVFVNWGYCALANEEICTLSTSHQPAICATWARVLVMIVDARAIPVEITSPPNATKNHLFFSLPFPLEKPSPQFFWRPDTTRDIQLLLAQIIPLFGYKTMSKTLQIC